MPRPPAISDALILKIEGYAAEVASVDETRPRPVIPLNYVAQLSGLSREYVRRLVGEGRTHAKQEQDGREITKAQDKLVRFTDAFDALCRAGADRVASKLIETAMSPRPDAVAAAKLVLPKIDPEGWADKTMIGLTIETPDKTPIDRIPQDMIDRMTPEDVDKLEVLESQIVEAERGIAEILASLSAS